MEVYLIQNTANKGTFLRITLQGKREWGQNQVNIYESRFEALKYSTPDGEVVCCPVGPSYWGHFKD